MRGLLVALAVAVMLSGCATTPRHLTEPPLSSQDEWTREQVDAVLSLYNFTDEGARAIEGLQVRHMLGRPGWFGSTGYKNYVGIGAARPSAISHEFSHSFWGSLPIDGIPQAAWDAQPGQPVPPGMVELRKALVQFLEQPPDEYEPLRARLRRIPDLVTGRYPGLYHLGEADMVYFTGGNLNLVPPILRRFYSPWLRSGTFETWSDAAEWYLGLPPAQRQIADAYHGIGGMDLGGFKVDINPKAVVDPRFAQIIAREDRQRLVDFRQQFNLYFKPIDGQPVTSDFQFWRGYLRSMALLAQRYPDVLAGSDPRSVQIKKGMDFLTTVDDTPKDARPSLVLQSVSRNKSLLKFVPALDPWTLATIVGQPGTAADQRAVRLVRGAIEPDHLLYLESAARVLLTTGTSPDQRGREFAMFIGGLDTKQAGRMNFILETFAAVDREKTGQVLSAMSPKLANTVMRNGPALTRFLMQPEDLIRVLGYGGDLSAARLVELARLMNDYVSASPSVDGEFLSAVYRRVIAYGRAPNGGAKPALEVFQKSGLLIEPFLQRFPREASALVAADPDTAARVFLKANPVRLPPARAIYLLIQSDPTVAARVTVRYEAMGNHSMVRDALLYFAHDAPRLQRQPGLAIALDKDGLFLQELARLKGDAWLQAQLSDILGARDSQLGLASPDLGIAEPFRETLAASLAALPQANRGGLQALLAGVPR